MGSSDALLYKPFDFARRVQLDPPGFERANQSPPFGASDTSDRDAEGVAQLPTRVPEFFAAIPIWLGRRRPRIRCVHTRTQNAGDNSRNWARAVCYLPGGAQPLH